MSALRARERLRQEREAFELRKSQSRWWFGLRFATVIVLLAIALGVFGVAATILLDPGAYSSTLVKGSGVAMILDLLAMAMAAFSHILRPQSQPILEPLTTTDVNQVG